MIAPRTGAKTIPGFCYITGTHLALTAAQWREVYDPKLYVRAVVVAGETWYRWRAGMTPQSQRPFHSSGRLAAEAYGVIAPGKAKP